MAYRPLWVEVDPLSFPFLMQEAVDPLLLIDWLLRIGLLFFPLPLLERWSRFTELPKRACCLADKARYFYDLCICMLVGLIDHFDACPAYQWGSVNTMLPVMRCTLPQAPHAMVEDSSLLHCLSLDWQMLHTQAPHPCFQSKKLFLAYARRSSICRQMPHQKLCLTRVCAERAVLPVWCVRPLLVHVDEVACSYWQRCIS